MILQKIPAKVYLERSQKAGIQITSNCFPGSGLITPFNSMFNKSDAIASNNYKDPTIMLAYQNTVFALTIDNLQTMNALVSIYESNRMQNRLMNKLNKKFNNSVPNGSQTANIGDLIVDLLNTLDNFNLNGLGLYQAEVDNNNMVTSWNRKKLTNNGTNFETENCN